MLEQGQRRVTKFILSDFTTSYKNRLIQLNLLPLMYQYELNDLIYFIKSSKLLVPTLTFTKLFNLDLRLLGHLQLPNL